MEFAGALTLTLILLRLVGDVSTSDALAEVLSPETLVGGIMGNRADGLVMYLWDRLWPKDKSPLTEQLNRAVWLSYKQALMAIASGRRAELIGPNVQKYRGQPIYSEASREAIYWYDQHLKELKTDIATLQNKKYPLPEISLEAINELAGTTENGEIQLLQKTTAQLVTIAVANAPSCYGPAIEALLAEQVNSYFAQQVSERDALWKFVELSILQGLNQNDQKVLTILGLTAQRIEQIAQDTQDIGAIKADTEEIKAILQQQSASVVSVPAQVIEVAVDQPNPFIYPEGRIEEPELFFEREAMLTEIFALLNSGSNVELVGPRKSGKSSLLKAIELHTSRSLTVQREPVYIDFNWVNGEDDFYGALCHFLKIENCKGFTLKRALDTREPALLLLDEIEKMNSESFTKQILSQLRGLAEGRNAPLKLVMAASKPLDILFPDSHDGLLTSPIGGVFQSVMIQPWSPEEVQVFIQQRLDGTGVYFSEIDMQQLVQNSRGNPREVVRGGFELYAKYSSEE